MEKKANSFRFIRRMSTKTKIFKEDPPPQQQRRTVSFDEMQSIEIPRNILASLRYLKRREAVFGDALEKDFIHLKITVQNEMLGKLDML